MVERTKSIYDFLVKEKTDAALVFYPENRRYYTGFMGSSGYALFLHGEKPVFFTDTRYTVQAQEQCKGYQIMPLVSAESVFRFLQKNNVLRLAVETQHISLKFAQGLQHSADIKELLAIDTVVRQDRIYKTEQEIASLQKACHYADKAFEYIVTVIHEGMTEAQINFELQTYLRRYDAVESTMERFIVASGQRGAMPHGVASTKPVQTGDFITMDYGCCVDGYWSDITRTVCLGKASNRQKEIYGIVKKAQLTAKESLRQGKTGREMDAAARAVITEHGYGDYFTHGLGHGLGLSVHEAPRLAPNAEGDIVLQSGMVVTIEPGIYIEGFGGVRIEDDVVVTASGCDVLTQSSQELIEIG